MDHLFNAIINNEMVNYDIWTGKYIALTQCCLFTS